MMLRYNTKIQNSPETKLGWGRGWGGECRLQDVHGRRMPLDDT